ncbi:MAG: 16S rRNA (cytidine(1402)-2'-O)-methyltransferase [Candidatus Rokuibacteriota bacterium]|nr:MAG: 16S rRNA (cytidine(1402)-2'-O)-methyltransferase [Candidatus Rokubacteria bacterium]
MRDHPRSHPQSRKADPGLRSERTDGLSGTLFVVATPIGNLEDITLRALRVLREADLVACEDTRRTRALLTHFDIHKPTVSYYEHNKLTRGRELLRELAAGRSIALVTDAGTPGISDPGVLLVREARANGVPVVPVPGPAALVAALSAAGISADRFVFDGFLPVKPGKRINRLAALRALDTTVVAYESPHRIIATLGALGEVYGEVELVVARELTKQFEEIVTATPAAHLVRLAASEPRGEFTLVIPAVGRTAPGASA